MPPPKKKISRPKQLIFLKFNFVKKKKIDLTNFKKNCPPPLQKIPKPNLFSNRNSWVNSRRSACAMGKWAPPLANVILFIKNMLLSKPSFHRCRKTVPIFFLGFHIFEKLWLKVHDRIEKRILYLLKMKVSQSYIRDKKSFLLFSVFQNIVNIYFLSGKKYFDNSSPMFGFQKISNNVKC